MGIFQQFPYSNFHEMNLDQIIKIMREMQDEWAATKTEWNSYKEFIDNYFENLNLNEETEKALRALVADGTLDTVIDPVIISEVTAWLEEHITQPTTPAIDTSLTIAGAAADAKATGDAIIELQSDIGDIESRFNNPNVMDYSQASLMTNYLIASNGAVSNSWTANTKNIKFPVQAGETYTLYSPYFNRVGICGNNTGVFTFDETYTPMSLTLYGLYGQFTVPNGVTWVLINYYSGTEEQDINNIKLYNQPYASLDTAIRVKKENLPKDIVYTDDDGLPPLFKYIENVLVTEDLQITSTAGKILGINGVVSDFSDQNYYVSNEVDIDAYSILKVSASTAYPSAYYALYDENHTMITVRQATGTGITDYEDYIAVPSNAKYIRVSQYLSSNHNRARVAHITGISMTSAWSEKSWVCIGDSLTQVNETATKRYYEYITDATGINTENYGIGGTGYANPNGTAGNFVTRMASVPTDADVYTIFGSFNDYAYSVDNNIPIGTATDSGTSTLCGYFNAAFDALFARVPLANLGVIAPCPWVSINQVTSVSSFGKDYCDALKAVCERRSIPFLNLYESSGLRPWDSSFRALVYNTDPASGVHPNEIGHAIIATKIKSFLESLLI